MLRVHLWIGGILAGFISILSVNAETLYVVDFDGVIIETRADRVGSGAGFPTRFRLFRNFFRSNALQAAPSGPEFIEVTTAELEAMEPYLAKGDGRTGTQNKVFKLSSGQEVIAGEYHLRSPDSYYQHHEGAQGTNWLLKAFKEAEARDPKGKSWKGPFWDYMTKILSSPETAHNFSILTARAHSREEWQEFFSYLKKRGHIKNLPSMDLIFAVSRREYDRFNLHFDSTEQKMGVLQELALQLGRRPLKKSDMVKDADGRGHSLSHFLVYVEDRPEIVEAAAHLFRRMAQARVIRTAPVKFGIFNGGTAQEVKDLGRPQFTVLTPHGVYRQAELAEIWGEHPALRSPSELKSCRAIIARTTQATAKTGRKS